MEKQSLIFYSKEALLKLTSLRPGETKLGEMIESCSPGNWEAELKSFAGKYILLGIEEDVGVIGNLGKPGARYAWKAFLQTFLNVQCN